MEQYLYPILFFLILGTVIGILLTIASKFFFVKTDETVEKISEALPGANCGGCGYSGCDGYAEAVAKGIAPTNLCKPGGMEVVRKVSEIMGVEAVETEREIAFVRCSGDCEATEDKFSYIGTRSCAAVEKFYNGKGKCQSGCHGFGDCAAVCDNNCISIVNGIAVVKPAECVGCGKCVKICAAGAITVENFLAHIDYEKCTNCGMCQNTCIHDAIFKSNIISIKKERCLGCGLCERTCPNNAINMISQLQDYKEVLPELISSGIDCIEFH